MYMTRTVSLCGICIEHMPFLEDDQMVDLLHLTSGAKTD